MGVMVGRSLTYELVHVFIVSSVRQPEARWRSSFLLTFPASALVMTGLRTKNPLNRKLGLDIYAELHLLRTRLT